MAGLRHIAIDGKTLRHSFQKSKGLKMLHAVSAWATEQHLILGQVMTDAKSNEITAIPKLLELLDLHGALITIDAMGCQKTIAAKIVKQLGDYVLAAKENQENLFVDFQATVSKSPGRQAVPAQDVDMPIPRKKRATGVRNSGPIRWSTMSKEYAIGLNGQN